MKPVSPKTQALIRKMLRECKLDRDWEETLFRLFSLTPTPPEKKRWTELGIWKGGKVHMHPEEMGGNLKFTFCLWHLAFLGMLNRQVK